MLTCFQVADYFLTKPEDEETRDLSIMKLLKLLYFAQGYSLALHDEPMFPEPIQAWKHGPVVPEIYRYYSKYGTAPIPAPNSFNEDKYPQSITDLLDLVYAEYGQYSAWRLRNMTHMEPPWREIYQEGENAVISLIDMATHFKQQLSVKRHSNTKGIIDRAG